MYLDWDTVRTNAQGTLFIREDLRNDTSDGQHNTKHTSIIRPSATEDPSQRHDGAGLQMTDHGAAHSSSSCNDEELRNVDQAGENSALRYMSTQFRSDSFVPYQQYQHPLALWYTGPMWRCIRERYDIQKQKSADRCLVE